MKLDYTSRYKYANVINVAIFVVVVAGVSMLYGKLQMLEAASGEIDRERLEQHEADLSSAQETIRALTTEIEALRRELEVQRETNFEMRTELKQALDRLGQ